MSWVGLMAGRGARQSGSGGPFLHSNRRQGKLLGGEGNVNVFKENSAGDTPNTIGSFEKIISGLAAMFTTEGIGKNEGLGKLTSAHEKTSAIKIPITFYRHDFFTALAVRWLRTLNSCLRSVVNVRAQRRGVNYT